MIVFVYNSTSMATHGRNTDLRIAGAQDDSREFVAVIWRQPGNGNVQTVGFYWK